MLQSPIKALNKTVTLRVVGSCTCLGNLDDVTDLLYQLGLKLLALIRVQLLRRRIATEELIHQLRCTVFAS